MFDVEIPATNLIAVYLDTPNGRAKVLFSYRTLVAAWLTGDGETKRYAASGQSMTTRKHLGQHGPKKHLLPGDHFEEVSQTDLQRIVNEYTRGQAAS